MPAVKRPPHHIQARVMRCCYADTDLDRLAKVTLARFLHSKGLFFPPSHFRLLVRKPACRKLQIQEGEIHPPVP